MTTVFYRRGAVSCFIIHHHIHIIIGIMMNIGLFWEVWCVLELLYTRVNLFKIIYKIYFKISLLNLNTNEILLL